MQEEMLHLATANFQSLSSQDSFSVVFHGLKSFKNIGLSSAK